MSQSKGVRRGLQLLLGFLLSAAGLYFVLLKVDWPTVGLTLRQIKLGWLVAAGGLEIVAVGVNAIRWRCLFWPHRQPSWGRLFGTLNVAQLANTVLPGRLGLPLRAVLVGDSGQSRLTAFTTLAVEKVLEGLTLLPIGLLVFLLLDLPGWLRTSALLAVVLVLVLLLVLAGSLRWKGLLLARSSRPELGRLADMVRSLLDGLDALGSAEMGRQLWFWSVLYWGLVAAVNWLAIRALDIQVSPLAALVLLVILQVGVRIPSLPAGIGVFDYLTWVSLALFGIGESAAFSVALILRLVFYLLPSLMGVGALLWMSVDLGRLRRTLKTVSEP